jgi:hypothetical protein
MRTRYLCSFGSQKEVIGEFLNSGIIEDAFAKDFVKMIGLKASGHDTTRHDPQSGSIQPGQSSSQPYWCFSPAESRDVMSQYDRLAFIGLARAEQLPVNSTLLSSKEISYITVEYQFFVAFIHCQRIPRCLIAHIPLVCRLPKTLTMSLLRPPTGLTENMSTSPETTGNYGVSQGENYKIALPHAYRPSSKATRCSIKPKVQRQDSATGNHGNAISVPELQPSSTVVPNPQPRARGVQRETPRDLQPRIPSRGHTPRKQIRKLLPQLWRHGRSHRHAR